MHNNNSGSSNETEAMALRFASDQPNELTALLVLASRRLADRPELLSRGKVRASLKVNVTPTYGASRFVRDAATATVAFHPNGLIDMMDEATADRRQTGGWCGDCIPAGALCRFFVAWLEQTDPAAVDQLSLFG